MSDRRDGRVYADQAKGRRRSRSRQHGHCGLPDNLGVGGYLDLTGTAVRNLPKDLKVGGGLDLRGTGINTIPKGVTVGGDIFGLPSSPAVVGSQVTAGGSYLMFGTSNNYASGITNQAVTIAPNGYVGIGVNNPTTALEAGGTVSATGLSLAATGKLAFANDPTNYYLGPTDFNGTVGQAHFGWLLRGPSGIGLKIDQDSNVGIGTTTPVSALHVSGTTALTWASGVNGSYGLLTEAGAD